jgi:hypothetical protein
MSLEQIILGKNMTQNPESYIKGTTKDMDSKWSSLGIPSCSYEPKIMGWGYEIAYLVASLQSNNAYSDNALAVASLLSVFL